MNRLKPLSLVVFALLCLRAAPPVLAHANLVKSDPAANAVQKIPPPRVRLWFSEAVEASFTTVRVLDTTGTPVDKGDSHRMADDSKGVEVSLPELPLGLYTVAWQAISAVDGHATSGSFVFTVGDVPLSDSSPRELMSLVDVALSASAPPPLYDVIVRGFNLLTLIALAGSFLFPALIMFPAIRRLRTQNPAWSSEQLERPRTRWLQRWLRFVLFSLSLYAIATLGVLVAQSITSGGLPSIGRVLTTTRFGSIWMLRVALLLALGLLVGKSWSDWKNTLKAERRLHAAVGLSVLLMITQSLNSHNAAVNDLPYLAFAADLVHLFGAAIWVGGLFQMILTLPAWIHAFEASERPRALATVIARFSIIGFLMVNVLVATGIYSLVVQVGSLEAFFETLYGQSLMLKIVIIGVVMAIAAFNLIVVRPSLAEATAQRALSLTRQFGLATALEAIGAIAILVVVGVMTSIAPARIAYDPEPKLIVQTARVDDLLITLGIKPGLVGSNDFDVKARDQSGQSVSNATVVRILGTMLDMDMGTQETTTTAQGDGHYTLRGDLLSMTGRWNLEVLVRRAGRDDARTTFALLALDKRPQVEPFSVERLRARPEALLGLGLTLFGFALGTASVLSGRLRRRVRWATLGGALGISALGLLFVLQTTAGETPAIAAAPSSVAPASARALRSPIVPDAANIAAGQKIFQTYCVACHGPQGKGNGPLAASLNPKPADLSVHARLHTEGEEFWIITNGIQGSAMPRWAEQLSDLERWQVVAFIRTLGAASATPAPTPGP